MVSLEGKTGPLQCECVGDRPLRPRQMRHCKGIQLLVLISFWRGE